MTTNNDFHPILLNGEPLVFEDEPETFIENEIDYGPFCFSCGRCTDHVGEHDELVEMGAAKYEDGGIVALTEYGYFLKSDAEVWTAIHEEIYRQYCERVAR